MQCYIYESNFSNKQYRPITNAGNAYDSQIYCFTIYTPPDKRQKYPEFTVYNKNAFFEIFRDRQISRDFL